MTQFILIKTSKRCSSLKPVEDLRDDFLLAVAGRIFPDSSIEEIYVLDVDGDDVDSLMIDAQKLVVESLKFEATALYSTIDKLALAVDEMKFWYGSEYEDLECIHDVSVLLSKVEVAVNDSTCELYIHYKKMK